MRQFLTPKWILSHLFVSAMVVVMVTLGFWQLDRLDERKDLNDEVRAAIEAEPRPVEDVLGNDPADHTAVVVRGSYQPELSFLVANRSYETQAGYWLVTPVRLADGRLVVVSRGWVPRTWVAGNDVRTVDTPTGEVEILGRVNESVRGGRIGTATDSGLVELTRLDLDRVEELLGVDVADTWVQLAAPVPGVNEIPVPVPPPGLDEGPHLSYAFQWFFFSSGAVIVYALILHRRRTEPTVQERA